jgi:hypothetical protein
MSSSGMRRRVGLVETDVSEERIASIFRVENLISKKNANGKLNDSALP